MDFLEEIRENWKLDAKTENNERYFYHTKEVQRITDGKRSYVIGRKGTGKTAISQFISKISDAEVFTETLSFKNFPFNELYGLKNDGHTAPNQYITLWKYIIYSHTCKMMARNENITSEIQLQLKKLYAPEPTSSLQRWIKKWTAHDFSLNVLGTGAKVAFKETTSNDSWIEKVDALEEVIATYIDQAKYYIIFDELDEDFKNILDSKQHENYTHLLTGLFKAVQSIKGTFNDERFRIFPVIFLRDDIYDILTDPDKTKWDDFKIDLEWNHSKIKDLIAFRISRAIDVDTPPLSFHSAWSHLFSSNTLRAHNSSREGSAFDVMAKCTHMRPRDFIKYIQACASSYEGNGRIPIDRIRSIESNFSSYLKRELTDEIHGIIPEISAVFDAITQVRKQTFSYKDFQGAFEKKVEDGAITRTKDVNFVLKVLFIFNVIGNQPRQKNQTVFRYLTGDAEVNLQENFVVHRGLLKALKIL